MKQCWPRSDKAAGGFSLVAIHAVGDGVVDGGDEVAEDAAQVAGPGVESLGNARAHGVVRRSDVRKTPGSPEMVHCEARSRFQYREDGD